MKRSPRLAHIPVLLLTGAFEPVDQARLQEAGCDGVLAKPFEPQLVIGRVKDLLSKPRQATAPKPSLPPDDHWSSSPVADAPAPSAAKPPSGLAADLDSYFDRLDAAFADLDAAPDLPKPPAPPSTGAAEEIDWFGTFPEEPPPDPPLAAPAAPPAQRSATQQVPAPRAGETPASPVTPQRSQPPAAPAASSTPGQLPSLADAFAAILAAEEGESSPVAPTWPSAGAPNTAASDDLVEQVTRRVLDRLSEHRVLREAVADVVSSIAERLVREEIERIKASIK